MEKRDDLTLVDFLLELYAAVNSLKNDMQTIGRSIRIHDELQPYGSEPPPLSEIIVSYQLPRNGHDPDDPLYVQVRAIERAGHSDQYKIEAYRSFHFLKVGTLKREIAEAIAFCLAELGVNARAMCEVARRGIDGEVKGEHD
jgi:hypothetical protein